MEYVLSASSGWEEAESTWSNIYHRYAVEVISRPHANVSKYIVPATHKVDLPTADNNLLPEGRLGPLASTTRYALLKFYPDRFT